MAASTLSASATTLPMAYTIVLDGVERYVRAIASLAHSIEVELNFPVQVNAYITAARIARARSPLRRPRRVDPADPGIQDLAFVRRPRRPAARDAAREGQGGCHRRPPVANRRAPRSRRRAVPATRPSSCGRDRSQSHPSTLTVGFHPPTVLTLAIGALQSLSFHDDRLNAQLPPRHLDDADVQATLGVLLRDAVRRGRGPERHRERSRRIGGCPGPPRSMPTDRTDLERRRNRRANTGEEVPTALFAGEGYGRRRCAAVCEFVGRRRCRPRSRDAVHLEKHRAVSGSRSARAAMRSSRSSWPDR